MKNILSAPHRELLRQFSWSNVLLALDFDGTLAAIAARPGEAVMRPRTRKLVEQAASLYPTVIISGRAKSDLRRKVGASAVIELIGNHGAEVWHQPRPSSAQLRGWRHALEQAIAGMSGVWIEDKGLSLAVHYRQSRQKRRARQAALRVAERFAGARVLPGKQAINILPADAPHKGIAIQRAAARLGCDTAIYLGDDETDEDVFAISEQGRVLAIRVGRSVRSSARYFVDSQGDVDAFLAALIAFRQPTRRSRKLVAT